MRRTPTVADFLNKKIVKVDSSLSEDRVGYCSFLFEDGTRLDLTCDAEYGGVPFLLVDDDPDHEPEWL